MRSKKKNDKFLWVYPGRKWSNLDNKWLFYGTKEQYKKWLKEWPVYNVPKVVKNSVKFTRCN